MKRVKKLSTKWQWGVALGDLGLAHWAGKQQVTDAHPVPAFPRKKR
jgi:hypothetical protein